MTCLIAMNRKNINCIRQGANNETCQALIIANTFINPVGKDPVSQDRDMKKKK